MQSSPAKSPASRRLKLLTYNVHSCIGTDRRLAPERIAEVIAEARPDIIGLQELDVGRKRTGGIDQAHAIAEILKMKHHFHAALDVEEERYGDAILTALPAEQVKAGPLPSVGEQRGALWIEVEVGDVRLQVLNTHLGLRRIDRMRQADALLGTEWLGDDRCTDQPVVLLGDFNSIPSSPPYKRIAGKLEDVRRSIAGTLRPSFPSRFPLLKIDHVFVSKGIKVMDAEVISTPLARLASDHLPLMATIEV
ncbi:Metal-dependent hydrolase, endonuclease/exonuclease/phosphatase family [Rhizobium sp. NFR07]|uniref:endonuclease/exonuclease/phosphatase family protein n=1 Tax=Rhizobium sp. NFR07 TaxID=1566262 RepID=UPI0008F18236|nr:endonuclease/exonuclease/phosphatase family protein [Rhizobium sp. NFR07]SFB17608.1 Metal-dependent hydrolase, endonuclease/exonuclease/phosphatase family [Rhizobium sp. NFR07]